MSCTRKGIEMKIVSLTAKRNREGGGFKTPGGCKKDLQLCESEILWFFDLPWTAKVITFEIHDRPAKDRLAFCVRQEGDRWCEWPRSYSLEGKKAVRLNTLMKQDQWLVKHLKFDKTYYVELWYEEK